MVVVVAAVVVVVRVVLVVGSSSSSSSSSSGSGSSSSSGSSGSGSGSGSGSSGGVVAVAVAAAAVAVAVAVVVAAAAGGGVLVDLLVVDVADVVVVVGGCGGGGRARARARGRGRGRGCGGRFRFRSRCHRRHWHGCCCCCCFFQARRCWTWCQISAKAWRALDDLEHRPLLQQAKKSQWINNGNQTDVVSVSPWQPTTCNSNIPEETPICFESWTASMFKGFLYILHASCVRRRLCTLVNLVKVQFKGFVVFLFSFHVHFSCFSQVLPRQHSSVVLMSLLAQLARH